MTKDSLKLQIEFPHIDEDSTADKKRATVSGAVGAISVAVGTALLKRNEKSKTGIALLGIGASAGLATVYHGEKASRKKELKNSRENLEKTVHEFNLGRPEGSPALEDFLATIDSLIDSRWEELSTIGNPERSYYDERFSKTTEDGKHLIVSRGFKDNGSVKFSEVKILESEFSAQNPDPDGVSCIVFYGYGGAKPAQSY